MVGGVEGDESLEAGDRCGAGEGGEAGGLLLGGLGHRVEDGADLGGVEGVEELADAEAVVVGEVGEGDVAGEVVVEEGVQVEG